jgi:hypothetical protein
MIPLYRSTPDDEMEHGLCPHCDTAMSIPCISIIDNLQKLESLLDCTLNTKTCHRCGESVTAEEPVLVNMVAHGIEGMVFVPLSYIERGYLSVEELAAPDVNSRTFYSLDELARQVRAQIILKRLRIGVRYE